MQSKVGTGSSRVNTRSAKKDQKEEDDMLQLQEMLNQQTMDAESNIS